jgi:iron complex transport system permease protein
MFKRFALLALIFTVLSALHFTIGTSGVELSAIMPIRLSIYLQYLLIGMVLSQCGLILQTLMSNPLAEPYILGVSSGASMGAGLAILLSLTPLIFFRTVFALIGASGVSILIWIISRRASRFSIGIAVLAGVGFNALFSGGIMLIQTLLAPNELHSSIAWLMGNIDYVGTGEIILIATGAIICIVFLSQYGKELDIYRSGDEMAKAVGVDTNILKRRGFFVVSIATACAVSVAGMIGFVGLIVPHIVRMTFRLTHRTSIIPLFLISSSLLLVSGIVSKRIVYGAVLPVGVITSIIGAPFFIYILVKRYRGV